MQGMLLHILVWTVAFGVLVARANRNLGNMKGKLYKGHVFLAWLLVTMYSSSFQMLVWASTHYNEIPKYFYVPIGPIPAWLNLFVWAADLIFGVMVVLIAFKLAGRKESGRKWLLRILPVLFCLAIGDVVIGHYRSLAGVLEVSVTEDVSIRAAVLVILEMMLVFIFYFYSKFSVREGIFSQ